MTGAPRLCGVLALLVAAAGAGCGPITYAGEVRRASTAVDAARAAGAELSSPYWWTRATQYLHKARELAGISDFQAANRFGRIAADAANFAEQEAVVAAKDRSKSAAKPLAPAVDKPSAVPGKDGAVPAKDKP